MLKKYKNQFVQFIKDVDFKSHEIEIKYENDSHNSPNGSILLLIKNTPLFFEIRNLEGDWNLFETKYTSFAPNFPVEFYPPNDFANFDICMEHFERWIKFDMNEYFEEQSRPDLLEIYTANKNNSISKIDFSSNEIFSENERKLLIIGLEEIKLLIREEFHFSNAQINLIDNRINYLEEASQRIGKTDYKGILVSTILSIITSLALNEENSKKLIRLFSKIIENIPHLNW